MLRIENAHLFSWKLSWFSIFWKLPIVKIGNFSVWKIVEWIMTEPKIKELQRRIQLQIMKSEWDFSGFEFSNLKDNTVARIEWILLDPLWFRFVPKTVGKSKPSLYIGWNIPEHVDSEEGDDLESAGIIMQLTSDSWYEFKLGDARIKLDKGSIYLFNHGLQHAVGLSSSYEEWLNKWAKPFLALVGSVEKK